ncbi:hypothetical protein [Salipiger mucosus]|uniref:Antifreeze glycopeptide polyprotein n=1 Tax=Salipiger mucosus DSM 16094 TaxID=1123237 RepID=S9QFG5_9RHOB|nr:hypothetical protein [Salipiger mucosus]EPX78358.1 hypothetical protein Salmuc_03974 [Salipiger mucosus DSM 16094]
MRTDRACLAAAFAAALTAPLAAQEVQGTQDPLSAIEWLEDGGAEQMTPLQPPEPPVADRVARPEVESRPLDAPGVEAAGLLPMSVTGLPPDLWSESRTETLVPLVAAVDPAVPALSALLFTLLLAEADPSQGPETEVSLLAARLDRLFDEGGIEPGLALIERAGGTASPALFTRWMDFALLSRTAENACRALERQPALSEDLATRIYCDARTGDWEHAATVLGTAEALGRLDERTAELLARFIDPALADGASPVAVPPRPTPLEFRLFEAIGETLPTQPLPVPFAVADLGGTSGWRAQVLAAERLARRGALSDNRLLGLYTERSPAASGGVWDRVAAVQALDEALESGRPDLVAPALRQAWSQMRSAGLLVPFSRLFGPRLAEVSLEGEAAGLALRAELLSPEYEIAAANVTGTDPTMRTVAAIAQGRAPEPLPDAPRLAAAAEAWSGTEVPRRLSEMLRAGKLGEALLRAIALFSSGAEGNHGDITAALATFRAVGLEDTARRAAIQALLLHDEGALR